MALREDADYIAQLDKDARSNDWSMKARAMIEILN